MHMTATRKANYPLQSDVFNSQARNGILKNGAYFLPQAFPEGSPQHPSYPQGHATIAGACVTILKAALDGNVQFSALSNGVIVTASKDWTALIPYAAPIRPNHGERRNQQGCIEHWAGA